MSKHKKKENDCTLMNVLYTIGGLILGILIGHFIIPFIFGSDDKQVGWPTQAPTTQTPTTQAPTQAPTQAQPMPAQAGGKRLFKNRYR